MLCAVLALGNESRGTQAYGCYVPGKVFKGLGGLSQAAIKMVKEPILMMHSRLPTAGANTVENAHPFEIKGSKFNIIGAHNGMVMNHHELNNRYGRKHEVDSMHIFSNLAEGEGLDDIYGYGAIEWASNDKPDIINLCKLSGGELAIYGIGENPDKVKGVVWSSDEDHVLQALQTIGVQYFAYEVKIGQVYCVQDGTLFYSSFNGMKSLALGEKANYYMDPNSWRNGMQDYTPSSNSRAADDIDEKLMQEYLEGVSEGLTDRESDTVLDKWRHEKSELKRMLGPGSASMAEIDSEEEFIDGRGWVHVKAHN